ncbi:MAG: Rv3235 family protein [Carbonactinosporaceae bacterium]
MPSTVVPSTVVPSTAACSRRLRRLPVPQAEPPYDDPSAQPAVTRGAGGVQEVLALPFALPSGLSATPEACPPRPQRPLAQGLTDPHGPAARLAQAIVEVLAGVRPASQLVRWTTQQVYTAIVARVADRSRTATAQPPAQAAAQAAAGSEPGGRPRPARAGARVHVTRLCEPADGVAEAAVLVRAGSRPRAMALRLEARNGYWICTALEVGP